MNTVAYSNINKDSKTLKLTEKHDTHVLQLRLFVIIFDSH